MKDKNLYQRRTDGDYKGYTEDSFILIQLNNYGAGNKPQQIKFLKQKL